MSTLYALAAPLPVALIVAAADDPTGPVPTITMGGILALLLYGFAADKFGSHSERDRLRQEVAAKDAALAEMNTAIRQELIPAMLAATRGLEDSNRALIDTAKALRSRPR